MRLYGPLERDSEFSTSAKRWGAAAWAIQEIAADHEVWSEEHRLEVAQTIELCVRGVDIEAFSTAVEQAIRSKTDLPDWRDFIGSDAVKIDSPTIPTA